MTETAGTTYGGNLQRVPTTPNIPGLIYARHRILSERDPRGRAREPFNLGQWVGIGLSPYFTRVHTGEMEAVPFAIRGAHGGRLTKLVTMTAPSSRALAMVIDCREGSPTFGQGLAVPLDWRHSLVVPPGVVNAVQMLEPVPGSSEAGAYRMDFDGEWTPATDEIRVRPDDPALSQWVTSQMLASLEAEGLWKHTGEVFVNELEPELLKRYSFPG